MARGVLLTGRQLIRIFAAKVTDGGIVFAPSAMLERIPTGVCRSFGAEPTCSCVIGEVVRCVLPPGVDNALFRAALCVEWKHADIGGELTKEDRQGTEEE